MYIEYQPPNSPKAPEGRHVLKLSGRQQPTSFIHPRVVYNPAPT